MLKIARILVYVVASVVTLAAAACSTGSGDGGRVPTSTGSTGVSSTATPADSSQDDSSQTGLVLSGFVAFGDFGGGARQEAVADAMERWVAAGHRVDALATTGDNVYETGDPRLFRRQLDLPYAELRKTRPLWVTLGNHDVAVGHGAAQLDYLGLPALPYAKELPGVQLLFVDGNHPDEEQGNWLDEQLSRSGAPFRVVVFHQPAYSCGYHGSTDSVIDRWAPIFERHRVALVLNGHDHHYERFLSKSGVTYVVTGGGGRDLYPYLPRCMDDPVEQAGAMLHHFVGIEVRDRSMTLTSVADDDTVIDQTTIER